MKKIYHLIVDENEEIKIVTEDETLEDIYEYLEELYGTIDSIYDISMTVLKNTHELNKIINTLNPNSKNDEV